MPAETAQFALDEIGMHRLGGRLQQRLAPLNIRQGEP